MVEDESKPIPLYYNPKGKSGETRMACWSAENATKAYLGAIKMKNRGKEVDSIEFISALAAGRNARLLVIACANAADYSTTLGLVAAAHQTGGQVICILLNTNELRLSEEILGKSAIHVKFVIGNVQDLLESEYKEADCIVVDCSLKNCEGILKTARGVGRNALVVGYNAFCMESWRWRCRRGTFDAHLLPIGEGLLVSRVAESGKNGNDFVGLGKRNRWVVRVDKYTGEEHVFRIRN